MKHIKQAEILKSQLIHIPSDTYAFDHIRILKLLKKKRDLPVFYEANNSVKVITVNIRKKNHLR